MSKRYEMLRDACLEAVEFEAGEFERGGDSRDDLDAVTLEFFCEWRERVKRALFDTPDKWPGHLTELKRERDHMERNAARNPTIRTRDAFQRRMRRTLNRIALLEGMIRAHRKTAKPAG